MTAPDRSRPSASSVFRAQLALAAAPPRVFPAVVLFVVLAQTFLLALAGRVIALGITFDGEGVEVALGASIDHLARGVTSLPVDEGTAALLFAAGAALAWGLFLPFHLWRGEVPSRRGYHWTMPVAHRQHDLLRVAAGAVWLLAIVAALLATAVATAALAGHGGGLGALSAWVWPSVLLGPLVPYLAVSVALVRAEHPAAWVWGTLGVGFMLWTVATAARIEPIRALLRYGVAGSLGLLRALAGPVLGETVAPFSTGPQWLLAWLAWTALSGACLWVVAHGRSRRRSYR